MYVCVFVLVSTYMCVCVCVCVLDFNAFIPCKLQKYLKNIFQIEKYEYFLINYRHRKKKKTYQNINCHQFYSKIFLLRIPLSIMF